jgi:aryl-alcohol dehydrogenase-like predicted oxidoreductase
MLDHRQEEVLMTDLTYRTLGRSGLRVTSLAMGAWALGGNTQGRPDGYAGLDDAEAGAAIRLAAERGINLVDTADVYGLGHSERALAGVLADFPDMMVATKVGNSFDEAAQTPTGPNLTRAYIKDECRASLRRLGRDVIDLYQLHTFDLSDAQIDEIAGTFEELVTAGLIRWFGVSNDDPAQIARFARSPHCTSAQIQLNVFDDNGPALDAAAAAGLGVVCRSPLAMGLLGGHYSAATRIRADDIRGTQPDWLKWFTDGVPSADYEAKLDAIRALLTFDGRTLAQGALSWIWTRSADAIPLPGFRNRTQVTENIGTFAVGPLPADIFAQVESTLGRA